MIKSLSVRNWEYDSKLGVINPSDILELFNTVMKDRDSAIKAKRVYSLSFIHGIRDEDEAKFIGECLVDDLQEYSIDSEFKVGLSERVPGSYTVFFKAQGIGGFLKPNKIDELKY